MKIRSNAAFSSTCIIRWFTIGGAVIADGIPQTGLPVMPSPSYIVPVMIGDPELCKAGEAAEAHAARMRNRCPRNAEFIKVEELDAAD